MALALRRGAGADGGDEVGQRALDPEEALRVASFASSPSQMAIPPSPIARHQPVHDVSLRGAAQLPTNEKRRSPLMRKTAAAAAGPAYQLHGGL